MGAVSGELAFIWQDDLTDDERALIESLEVEFGDGERLLGTNGPPQAFALTAFGPAAFRRGIGQQSLMTASLARRMPLARKP
jgi:hypothetical protein